MEKAVKVLLFAFFLSCSGNQEPSQTENNLSLIKPNCSHFKSSMYIPQGLKSQVGKKYAGKEFAQLLAVDKGSGNMKITLLPPKGKQEFKKDFLEYYNKGSKLRLIACKGDSTYSNFGVDARRACSSEGPINILAKKIIGSSYFTEKGLMVENSLVHSTNIVATNGTSNEKTERPDLIILSADLINKSPLGDIILAFGKSPYYNGCYPSE